MTRRRAARKRTLQAQGQLTLTYEGDADDLTVVSRAYVAMQTMERAPTRLGFTGWAMPVIYVVKKKRRKRVVRK